MTDHPTAPVAAPAGARQASVPARTWTSELRALFTLGWPLIVAQLAQNALFTTDVIMMGWLGSKFLAAGTLATAVMFTLQLLGVGLLGAVAPMVAQALGAGQQKAVRRIVRQGLWVALLLAAVITPIVYNLKPILEALGQEPELAAMAEILPMPPPG